jgi:hypothetical protein
LAMVPVERIPQFIFSMTKAVPSLTYFTLIIINT